MSSRAILKFDVCKFLYFTKSYIWTDCYIPGLQCPNELLVSYAVLDCLIILNVVVICSSKRKYQSLAIGKMRMMFPTLSILTMLGRARKGARWIQMIPKIILMLTQRAKRLQRQQDQSMSNVIAGKMVKWGDQLILHCILMPWVWNLQLDHLIKSIAV